MYVLPLEVLLGNSVFFFVPLDLPVLCLRDLFGHIWKERFGLVVTHRLMSMEDFCGSEPVVDFVDHDALAPVANLLERCLVAAALGRAFAEVREVELAREVFVEHFCVLLDLLRADLPAV